MSRNTLQLLAIDAVLLAFGAFSIWAMSQVGYLGIWMAGLESPGAMQILLDLIIVCSLAILWMVSDARARGATVWPFVLITLAAGAFGPLLYLAWRQWSLREPRADALQIG